MAESNQLFASTGISTFKVSAVRIESSVPVGYRLIRKEDGNGRMEYLLQGLFTWRQGQEFGREWRDLETQDWLYADDNVPF